MSVHRKVKNHNAYILLTKWLNYDKIRLTSDFHKNRKFRISSDVAKQARAYIFENFSIDYKNYDIIKGYRADDSYFSFANAFLNNTIPISQLEGAMVLGKLSEQIVVLSEKAFTNARFVLLGVLK